MKVAIIPARGGSKRIPGKNIKPFAGKPIIAYSIEAALTSSLFDRVIVSTDSQEIAAIARVHGAETPFVRPDELADDFTTTADVLLHALNWLTAQQSPPSQICCLYATAPFVQPRYLKQGLDLLLTSKAASVFSVTSYPASIYRALKQEPDGRLAMVWPEYELTRSNDLPETFHDAGQFYWLDAPRFMNEKIIYNHDSRPVILPRFLTQDIDTPEDWVTAEAMHQTLQKLGAI
ncbi:MAG: pseudaminic acid cytidylyltransferase [Proteobacteria bacterium]|nr:pseudaminic acid cytidylyltransferase [Desulfobulbaceae bacterium]MBU4153810.1 pseudaminic acid cytidylyltransferase [Pseudomonadota bacterium]MDP2104502.1 pseudaminic acid cytidylyltransferase [Desulfobulbaceae bacterium]